MTLTDSHGNRRSTGSAAARRPVITVQIRLD